MRNHYLVAFEDLQVSNMAKNYSLAKSISDAGWGQLMTFAKYKAERVGKTFVKVDAKCTTQECAFCGALNKVDLSVREFECTGCRRWLRRDKNAARVVLKRAIAQVGQDRTPSASRSSEENPPQAVPELTPVETGPPPHGAITPSEASPVVEAGTTRLGTEAGSPRPSDVGGCHLSSSWTQIQRARRDLLNHLSESNHR